MKKLISLVITIGILVGGYYALSDVSVDNSSPNNIKVSSLQKGLVAHYPLDKESLQSATTFADKTPNENTGTSANTPVFTTDRMGQADRAMSFDGASDCVDCGNDASLNITDAITISAWVKTAVKGNGILYKDTDSSLGPFLIHTPSATGYLRGVLNDNAVYVEGTTNICDNEWHHIVFTYNKDAGADQLKIYLNNNLDGVSTYSTALNTNAETLKIGKYYSNTYVFNGSIADVRIYNRALDQTEITMLYDMYRPKLSAGSLQKGLVFDMPLTSTYTKDETAGAEVMTDRTPYSNDGQNSGGDVDTDHTTFVSANSDHVRIPDSESLSPTVAMTAMIWVKGAAQANEKGVLSHLDYGNNQRSFGIFNNQNTILGILISDNGTYDAGHRKYYDSSIVVLDNTWHLVGFTFNAGTLKLFIDGVEDTNPTKSIDDAITTIHNSTADVTVGCYLANDTPGVFFDGDISGAKVWNRALSDAEVLGVFEKGR